MSDHTETSYRSLGDNLLASIKGVAVGVVLFLVAFPILWWNEGRTDLSTVAKKAVIVKADGSSKDGQGTLVSITGALEPEGTLGDPDFLKPGRYAKLHREVEMYAWVEKVTKKTEKQLGGGTKETKTYHYEKKWTSRPEDAEDFKVPEGHENPAMPFAAHTAVAEKASVGAYGFDPGAAELPPAKPIALTPEAVTAPGFEVAGGYLYRGEGTPDSPRVGDVRVSFQAVEGGRTVTLYGQLDGNQVGGYLHQGKDTLYRVVDGTHAQAVAALHGEHTTITWVLRILGFVFLWFGLALVLGPINAVLDIIPFLGSAGRAVTGLAMFPVALVLAGLTITVSIIAHSPILLVAILALSVVGGVLFVRRRAARAKAAMTPRLAA